MMRLMMSCTADLLAGVAIHGIPQSFQSRNKEGLESGGAFGDAGAALVVDEAVGEDERHVADEFDQSGVAPLLDLGLDRSQIHRVFDHLHCQ